jgi:hypothetical protein
MNYISFFGCLSMLIMPAIPSSGQSEFKTALKQSFDVFDSAATGRQRAVQSDRISVIAARWDKEWITHYYLAYTKAVLSEDKEADESKRDALLDVAETEIEKAARLPGHLGDELELMSAFVSSCRIGIDPMARYMKYGKAYSAHLKQAIVLNPNNPRIYYLQGSVWFGMPKFAGGGPAVAMPFLIKADSLYAKEQDDDIMRPYWGKRANRALLIGAGSPGVSGTWAGSLPMDGGGSYPLRYFFGLEKDKLTGSTVASGSTVPISDGKIEGDSVSFYVDGMGEKMLHFARYYPVGDSLGMTIQMGGRAYHATLFRSGK